MRTLLYRKRLSSSREAGVSLIETTIVMLISGILLAAAVLGAKPVMTSINTRISEQRAEEVTAALSLYAQRYNRLPCPAMLSPVSEPFGAEVGSGVDGANIDVSCTGSDAVGIVPFRTLGLSEKTVRDGWGRFFSYHVSPAFTVPVSAGTSAQLNTVHESCRTANWIQENEDDNAGYQFDLASMMAANQYVLRDDETGIEIDHMYHGLEARDNQVYFDYETHSYRYYGTDYNQLALYSTNDTRSDGSWGWFCCGEKDGTPAKYYNFEAENGFDALDLTLAIRFQRYSGAVENGDVFFVQAWGEDLDADPVVVEIDPETLDFTGIDGDPTPAYKVLSVDSETLLAGEPIHRLRLFSSKKLHFALSGVAVPGGAGVEYVNKNPAKARFCCPNNTGTAVSGYESDTDVIVVDENGDSVVTVNRPTAGYGDINELVSAAPEPLSTVAYVLVSHGANGYGALSPDTPGARLLDGVLAVGNGRGVAEAENADVLPGGAISLADDSWRRYVYAQQVRSGSSYYDDLLIWRTPEQVYAEFGDNSCAMP